MSSGSVRKYKTSAGTTKWLFVTDAPTRDGSRKQVFRRGFTTKREAGAALEEMRAEMRTQQWVEPSKETLGSYLHRWLGSQIAAGNRHTTVASYRSKVEAYVLPTLGDVPLQAVSAMDLDHLYGQLIERGLSLRTVRYTHSIVRKALVDAKKKHIVATNVAVDASPPASKNTKAPAPKVWDAITLQRFLDATRESEHHPMIVLAAMTGMRRGELLGLRWSDVELDEARLQVRNNLTVETIRWPGQPPEHRFHHGEVKSRRGRRTIDIDAAVTAPMLRARRKGQREQRLVMGAGWQNEADLVFTMQDGSAWNPEVVSRAFTRLVDQHDFPKLSLHGLRHTHATLQLAAGTNPRVVSERLGHSSVGFTLDTYASVLPGQQAEAAAAFQAMVFGA